jgi:hypothetical protein
VEQVYDPLIVDILKNFNGEILAMPDGAKVDDSLCAAPEHSIPIYLELFHIDPGKVWF